MQTAKFSHAVSLEGKSDGDFNANDPLAKLGYFSGWNAHVASNLKSSSVKYFPSFSCTDKTKSETIAENQAKSSFEKSCHNYGFFVLYHFIIHHGAWI